MQILENRERLSDGKQKGIKTKIKSKPIQQKNSIKSNISYPNLEKWRKTYQNWFRLSDGGRCIA